MVADDQAVVMIGHSHLNPILAGLARFVPSDSGLPAAHFFVHDVWRFHTNYADSAPGGGVAFNSALLKQFDEIVPDGMPRNYVGVLGGNGHIVLALTKHPRAFDFVLPERPELPIELSSEIVPYDYFCESLKPWMMSYIWQMIAFRQALGRSFICLETPPPSGDDEYVATHLGTYIADPNNVVSRSMRYKIWRAHSELVRFFCTHNGIEFLPAPAESMDAEGFLRTECQGRDATHGNERYGQLVVRQIEQRFGLAFKNYQIFA